MSWGAIDSRLAGVRVATRGPRDLPEDKRKVTGDPRIVIAGGGNYSEKNEHLIIIKGSGSYLYSLTLDEMVECSRSMIDDTFTFFTPKYIAETNGHAREDAFKEWRLKARVDENGRTPSVELPVHDLLGKYVLHTHSTAMTILSSLEETPELAKELLGEDYLLIDFIVPGILLGIEAKRLIKEHGHIPNGIMQRNHGTFFNNRSFSGLIEEHNSKISKVQTYIEENLPQKQPYGSDAHDFESTPNLVRPHDLMKALYHACFRKPAEKADYQFRNLEAHLPAHRLMNNPESNEGTVYYFDTGLARDYARSKFARDNHQRFTWISPDHIVSEDKHTDYIELSDPTNLKKCQQEIKDQVKPHGRDGYARVFVIAGLGIATVGGHIKKDRKDPEAKARYSMQFAHDGLHWYRGARAIGTPTYLSRQHVNFIMKWIVEKDRQDVFLNSG